MKTHPRYLLLAACLLGAAGCSTEQTQAERKPDFVHGGRVFDQYCAQCHMNADNEAPQLDEPDDWEKRTPQWAGVLKDHARNGFIGMPAKGGNPKLNNQSIDDALYFLEIKLSSME
jgi:cytochrome c5